MANKNCLEGMQCPKCDHEDCFVIRAECIVEVTDDGTDDARDFDWGSDSYCQCSSCGFHGKVGDFMPEKPTKPYWVYVKAPEYDERQLYQFDTEAELAAFQEGLYAAAERQGAYVVESWEDDEG